MASKTKKFALASIGLFVLIQAVPVDRSNPPVESDFQAPPEIDSLLRRACYDCHSNETRWPRAAWVAPFSWWIARDVHKGREAFNYSKFGDVAPADRARIRELTWAYVEAGEMPTRSYMLLHPEAKLDATERRALADWAQPDASSASAQR